MARLSLQDPLFVSVHENASESTPTQLEQVSLVRTSSIQLNSLLRPPLCLWKNRLYNGVVLILSKDKEEVNEMGL